MKKITFHQPLGSEDLKEMAELYLKNWQKVELPSTYLHTNPSDYSKLFYNEVFEDLQEAAEKGICIFAKYEGKMVGFTAAKDVNDIEMLPIKKPYEDLPEAYERVVNSFYCLMKSSHKRGEAIFIEFITIDNSFEDTGLEESLLAVIGYSIYTKGYKEVFVIPSNKEMKHHEKYQMEIVSEINLDALQFGDSQPFKGIDFKIKLVRIPVAGNFSTYFSSLTGKTKPKL